MKFISHRYEVLLDENEDIVFGKLYEAKDLVEDRLVYIEILKENEYIDKKFLPNLIDESTMLLEVNSPHIAKILDVGVHLIEDERYYFIVSEYFAGIELRKVIKGNYMDLNSIVKITRKILIALDLSYRHNMYHGSLTEDNIFVDENYNIKIYDYCITKANKGINIRKDNNIYFLSPYQLNIDYTDKQSDFFSLGIILFDAIFKKMPFGIGKDREEMLRLIDKGIDWNSVGINNENIALVNIVKKLISRTEKYNNVDEIRIDLSKFMYVKADIKSSEKNEDITQDDESEKNIKIKSKFWQKLLLLTLTVGVLFTILGNFK